MAICQYCPEDEGPKPLKQFKYDHGHRHAENKRACQHCWERWLSAQVEDKPANKIRCIDDECSAIINKPELEYLARKDTLKRYAVVHSLSMAWLIFRRYESKIELSQGRRCMNRCSEPEISPFQDHDAPKHGRVFTCELCSFAVCTTCDRPEHVGESCEKYQRRMTTAHGKDEELTMKNRWACPGCNVTIELEERGCGFTICETCNYRFCQDCFVGWVGKGGEYELGAAAHKAGCNYTIKYSAHSLKYKTDKRARTKKAAKADTAEKRKIVSQGGEANCQKSEALSELIPVKHPEDNL